MARSKTGVRYGCPNQTCTSFKNKKLYNRKVHQCPDCGSMLIHVCRSKKCYTVVEDPLEPLCLGCKARHADRAKVQKIAIGAFGASASGLLLKYRHEIGQFAKSLLKK